MTRELDEEGTMARRWTALAAVLVLAAGGAAAAARSGSSAGGKTLVVPLQVVKQGKQVLALVPVKIDGAGPFTFALDTGASRSLVDSQLAKKLHVPKQGAATKAGGVAGVAKVTPVKVRSWSAGPVKLPATTIVMTNLPFGNAYTGIQGLLGSDMLSRFDVITIDYKRQQLRLHPR
jgi:hypothetical protein